MRAVRLVLLAVLVALLTACASAAGHGTAPRGPTAADNQAAAQAEAERLMTTAAVPPGAERVTAQPAGLSASVMGRPGTSQLIDTVEFFVVPDPLATTQAWFQGHPQDGLTLGASGSMSGPGDLLAYGFQYEPTEAQGSWGTATLDISLASRGSTTGIRVEGVAQWIDPTPVTITSSGPGTRVTIAAGCPATDKGLTDVSNPDSPDLDDRLLPDATPSAGLTCVYDGGNGDAFALVDSEHLDPTQAAAAAAEIQALPLGSRGDGPHSCPADDGRATIVVFSYPGRADVDIWKHTSGCSSTDNGHVVSGAF